MCLSLVFSPFLSHMKQVHKSPHFVLDFISFKYLLPRWIIWHAFVTNVSVAIETVLIIIAATGRNLSIILHFLVDLEILLMWFFTITWLFQRSLLNGRRDLIFLLQMSYARNISIIIINVTNVIFILCSFVLWWFQTGFSLAYFCQIDTCKRRSMWWCYYLILMIVRDA